MEVKDALTATVNTIRWALKVMALSRQCSSFWPQPAFTKDLLHALEITRHGGMVFGVIKVLKLSIGKCARVHANPTVVVCPPFLQS